MFRKLTELFRYYSVEPGQFVDHNGCFTQEAMDILKDTDDTNYQSNIRPILDEMHYLLEKGSISLEQFSKLSTIRARTLVNELSESGAFDFMKGPNQAM